jgi:hypothetical protein
MQVRVVKMTIFGNSLAGGFLNEIDGWFYTTIPFNFPE